MLNTLVRSHFSDTLKGMNFRAHGLNWTARDGGVIHVINFQSSRFADPGEVSFTINVGVLRPEVRALIWPDAPESKISVSECFPCARAGHLRLDRLGSDKDLWWHGSKSKLTHQTAQQVTSYIKNECTAYFRAFSDPVNVLAFFEPRMKELSPLEKLNLAAYQILHGDRSKGFDMISQVASRAPAWSERTRIMLDEIKSLPG